MGHKIVARNAQQAIVTYTVQTGRVASKWIVQHIDIHVHICILCLGDLLVALTHYK